MTRANRYVLAVAAAAFLVLPARVFAGDVRSTNGVVSGNGTLTAIEGDHSGLGNANTDTPFPLPGIPFVGFGLNNPPNFAFLLKTFNSTDPMDISLNMLNSGSTTEFIFGEQVTNNTPFTWTDFHLQVGFGAGNAFTLSNPDDGLNFDVPNGIPTPTNSKFSTLNHQADVVEWSNGSIAPGQSFLMTFSADLPDSNINMPPGALFDNPPTLPPPQPGDPDPSVDNPGYAFTFRQFPTLAPNSGASANQPLLPASGDPLNGFPFFFPIYTGPSAPGANFFFIDPLVAVGYDFDITGSNATSLVLPNVGDGQYDLYLHDGSNFVFDSNVSAGVAHNFAAGGVNKFRVLGIETSAALDPTDPTAFVTGLTFADANAQVGVNMLPITFDTDQPSPEPSPEPGPGDVGGGDAGTVPEPSSMVLLSLGAAAVLTRRRHAA